MSENPLRNIISSEYVYKGHIGSLRVDMVKFPSGELKPREVVEHKPAVAILPVDEKGRILLVKQYRHAVVEEIFEIPAGIVENGEEPRGAASRELREEIGFLPRRLEEIAEIYSSPGFCTEKIYVYYAAELAPSPLPQDDDEYIEVFGFAPAEIEKMISERKIRDGKTVMAYYWYKSGNSK